MFYKLNAEQGEGKELAADFAINGYPTYVVTNAQGETIRRWWGYDDAQAFIADLSQATADPTTIAEKQARFESSPTAGDAFVIGQYYLTRDEVVEAVGYLRRAIELGRPEDAYEYTLVEAMLEGIDDQQIGLDELKTAADQALASDYLDAAQRVDVARSMVTALRKTDPASAATYIAAGLAATEGSDDEKLAKARQRLLIDDALLVKGDAQLALSLKRETLPEGWEQDAGALNNFAWWCFENQINLEQAEGLARHGVELAASDTQKAQILDTEAEIANLRGDREAAVALTHQAIDLDPDNDYYGKQLGRFSGAVADESVATAGVAE